MYLVVLGPSCSMWDLVPCPGIKPWPPEWSQPLDHQGSPNVSFFNKLLALRYALICMQLQDIMQKSKLLFQVLWELSTQFPE